MAGEGRAAEMVVTAKVVRSIARITTFPVSATARKVPVGSTATPCGDEKIVAVPTPFVRGVVTPGVPAIVVVRPVGEIMRMHEFARSATKT